LIKSTNIEQEHRNGGDTEGIKWQRKIVRLVDFPWFCIAYVEVDVLRQFHFTILTALCPHSAAHIECLPIKMHALASLTQEQAKTCANSMPEISSAQ